MAEEYKTQLRCAWLVGEIKAEEIEAIAEAGFDGVETRATNITVEKARESRRICEANGIKIHSVMRGVSFNRDEDAVKRDLEEYKKALHIASELGASTALCVPGRTNAPKISPRDFRIKFDPETLEVTQVVDGDNAPFADYIAAQNEATRATLKYLPMALDAAAYEGIRIGLENVWNNLWCTPEYYAAFVGAFDSPWVGSYFDLGNHVKYAPTENWLRAIGKGKIVKMHFKDFLFDADAPGLGKFVPVGQGSVDWKLIRRVLDEIEYNGFLTIEFEEGDSRKLTLKDHARKFKNFFEGKDILDGVPRV